MNPYHLDITQIVKYVCTTSVAIVAIVMGCVALVRIAETRIDLLNGSWDDEE